MTDQAEQQRLKAFLERRHPRYNEFVCQWDFLESCYEGGRAWFEGNIFKYLKEGPKEYQDRVSRAYRFNHSREVVDLVNKYIFKGKIERNEDDAPDEIKQFWEHATLNGGCIDTFMRYSSTKASTFGCAYIVVDSSAKGEILTKADEKAAGLRVYAYLVKPQDMLDISFDDNGEINWCLIREVYRDDGDPIDSSGECDYQYRLWMRDQWQLYRIRREGRKQVIYLDSTGPNQIGVVPVIKLDHVDSDDKWTAPSLIGEIGYLDRAVANYLSNLDAIIQDQTFSQLAMPGQALMPGDDTHNALLELGTKRIFIYNGESGAAPQFISPDPKQATVIIGVINKIISEIYHTVGMAGERTKQDNAQGIDNSSGVAKAYDFERMNALLTSKADTLKRAENAIIKLVCLYRGVPAPELDLIAYPATFDVRGIYDEFEIATQLDLIAAPDEVRREQMKAVIAKLFPALSQDLKKTFEQALKSWPPAAPEPALLSASGVGKPKLPPSGQANDQTKPGQATGQN